MNADQFQSFKQQIIAAVDKHLAEGGTIATGGFGAGKCLCPLSCLGGENLGGTKPTYQSLTEQLGFLVSDDEVWGFILAFDGGEYFESHHDTAMKMLGVELRNKYLPLPKE